MSDPSEPLFSLPRASLSRMAEVAGAYGWGELPRLVEPRVLDIGAGVGIFAVMASQVWPDARITCYEPAPESFAQLEQNLGELPVDCRNVAVHDPAAQLFPCDVLKIDAEEPVSILTRYLYLQDVTVLLVVTRSEDALYEIHGIAAASGLTPLGRHVDSSGCTALRFVRVEASARVAAEGTPQTAAEAVEPVQPIRFGERPLNLYVSLLTGGGQIWGEVEHCLHELRNACRENRVGLTLMRESTTGVDRARNRQSERCLERVRNAPPREKPTHMLQLDDDIVFDPRDILKLMRSDMDVTAIIYPRKEIDWDRVARAVMAGADASSLMNYESPFVMNYVTGQGVRHPEIGSLLEVEEVGTGCLMIKVEALAKYVAAYREELEYVTDYVPRDVVHHQIFHCERDPSCPREQMLRQLKRAAMALRRAAEAGRPNEQECAELFRAARAWSDTVDDPGSIGRYLTEDYSFCRRWRLLGGKIYVLREAELGHIGTYMYRGSLATAMPTAPPSTGDQPVSEKGP
jgi:predicted RNA methylase